MKIIFIGPRNIPAEYGGVDTHTEKIGFYLANKEGHRVVIYVHKSYCKLQDNSYKGMEIRKINSFPNKYVDTEIYGILATFQAMIEGADVIHYQGGSALFAFIPYIFGFKIVCTVHSIEWQRAKWGPIIKLFLKLIEMISFRFSHRFIVISKVLEGYFKRKYPRSTKIVYIPNGADVVQSLPPAEIIDYGLDVDKYILFVGRIVPEKGLHYLVDAYKRLKCDLKLVIAGDAPHCDSYSKNLKKAADRNIIFMGFIKGNLLQELYSNAYIYVLPSELEGLSVSLLEAMSFGKCVLASDIAENKDVIGKYGVYFRNKDVEDLAKKLDFLINHKDLVKIIGEEAQSYVNQNFSWSKAVSQLEGVYESL